MSDRSEVCPYLGKIHLHSECGTDTQLTMEFRNISKCFAITDNEQHKQMNGLPGTHSYLSSTAHIWLSHSCPCFKYHHWGCQRGSTWEMVPIFHTHSSSL